MKTSMWVVIGLVIVGGIAAVVLTNSKTTTDPGQTTADRVEADGTIVKPDGTMIKPDGTSVSPDGTMLKTDGTVVKPDGTMVKPDGTMIGPDGKMIEDSTNSNSANTNTSSSSNTNTTTARPSATYVDYSAAAFSTARATGGQTVLYFHANWCPVCQVLDPSIRTNLSTLPNGLTLLKVNYDTSGDLKKEYGVTYQHTFVQVDSTGKKIKLWNGSSNSTEITDQLL